MNKILIVGATSAIAEACARIWAQRGDHIFLAARNATQLQAVAADLTTRGSPLVGTRVFDANTLDAHAALLAEATQAPGGLDTVLIAHGTLTDQDRGTIAVISSVAGDRGRQSNYVYGSAKALVSAYASDLRQRLAKKGVAVLTIKPGFVSTPMTAHLKQGALTRAIDKRATVLYTPGFWRLIMLIIKHIPEFVFVKIKL
jgi:decaprenylphospho-beta-D-erythro-pentofuranosid-2-ulose 2-reductase